MSTTKRELTPAADAVAGALAGMAAVCVSYPADYVKTRLQFAQETKGLKTTIPNMVRNIYAEGHAVSPLRGIFGFYRGLDQLLPEAAFKTMLRFVAFAKVQEAYRSVTGVDKMTMGGNLVSGLAAGVIETTLVVQPFERGKTLRADYKNPYKVWGEAFRVSPAKGLRSIYTGYVPCLGRQAGNQATAFTVFYEAKRRYLESSGNKDLNTIQRLTFGFFSGAMAVCVTMPLDVAKSISQKQTGPELKGTIQIMKDVYANRGFGGLYAGLTPRVLRVGVDRAVGFLAFEFIMERLRRTDFFTRDPAPSTSTE